MQRLLNFVKKYPKILNGESKKIAIEKTFFGMAIKGIHERLSLTTIRFHTMNADYDYEPIYKQVYHMNQQSIIAYNRRLCFVYHSNRKDKYGFKRTFNAYECEDCINCSLRYPVQR